MGQTNSPTESMRFEGQGFSLDVPAGAEVQVRHPAEDFLIYRVPRADDPARTLLQVYSGNHPRFPNEETAVAPETVRVGERDARSIRKPGSTGGLTVSREVLVPTGQEQLGLGFLHFWYENLEPADAAAADAVIRSLRIMGPDEARPITRPGSD